jgi:hypothetical protein
MTTTPTQKPKALQLADRQAMCATAWIEGSEPHQFRLATAAELRRQHAEIARLTAENARLKAENEALKEKVAGCDIMGLAEEQRQLRGPFHGIGTPNSMFDQERIK